MSATPLRVVVIAPHAAMASELRARFIEEVGFEVVTVLGSYPGAERLRLTLDHFQADSLYMQCDDLPASMALLQRLQGIEFRGPVVACAMRHQPDAVIDLLRSGAFDYLHMPLDEFSFREVAARVESRCPRNSESFLQSGARVVGFTSSKPGSGATTLATQAAFALRRGSGRRVLSIDLNVLSGTTSGWAESMVHPFDVVDAVAALPAGRRCFREVIQFNGVSMLPAPAIPEADSVPVDALRSLLEMARQCFDWVVVDLPCAASPETLGAAALMDDVVVVTTPELASLNTLQRNTQLLYGAGVEPASLHVALNRTSKRDPLQPEAISAALKMHLSWVLPNDYFSLQAAGQLGLTGESALALAVRKMATDFCGTPKVQGMAGDGLAGEVSLAVAG
ncbi:AAA family ATPase [Paludibaculum fermentans]|uniref:AAA family ATPase n=1 Tax=Paludibaculum fermentans TaxID=1473598 RepID=UPI003EB7E40A